MDCNTHAEEGRPRSQVHVQPVQDLVSNMMNGLRQHEQVVAELRRQLDGSLAAHQQRLMQELELVIQQTAGQALAPLPACAGYHGTASQSDMAVYGSAGQVAASGQSGSSVPACRVDLQDLQAATAHAQVLQQQLDAAEAKLSMHRAAAVAAKQRITDLEHLLQQHRTAQNQCSGHQQTQAAADAHQPVGHPNFQLPEHLQQVAANSCASLAESTAGFECGLSKDCNQGCCKYSAMSQEAHSQQSLGVGTSSPALAVPAGDQCWDIILSPRVVTGQLRFKQYPSAQQDCQAFCDGHMSTGSNQGSGLKSANSLTQSATVDSPNGQQIQQLQQQSTSLLDKLRLTLRDNTVLSYECMHLQNLLVQERLVGRGACQSVALKLACDVVTLTQQLEEVRVELDIERLKRELQESMSADVSLEHETTMTKSSQQHAEYSTHGDNPPDRSGDDDGDTSADAETTVPRKIGVTAAECVAAHQRVMMNMLGGHTTANKALLQELEQQMTRIHSAYQDETWADSVENQLAAIEQAVHQEHQAFCAEYQASWQTAAATAVNPGNTTYQSSGNHRSLLQETAVRAEGPSARSATWPKPQAYVTTPSGRVSMIYEPGFSGDAAVPRRSSTVTGGWPSANHARSSRMSCCEHFSTDQTTGHRQSTKFVHGVPAPVSAAALQPLHVAGQVAMDTAALAKKAMRRSSLMRMTGGLAAQQQHEQPPICSSTSQESCSKTDSPCSSHLHQPPESLGPTVWHSNPLGTQELVQSTAQPSATLETLQQAAEQLSSLKSDRQHQVFPDTGGAMTQHMYGTTEHGGFVRGCESSPSVDHANPCCSQLSAAMQPNTAPVIRDNPMYLEQASDSLSNNLPAAGRAALIDPNDNASAVAPELQDIAVQLIDAMQQAAAVVLGRQPAAVHSNNQVVQDNDKLTNLQQQNQSALPPTTADATAVCVSDSQYAQNWVDETSAMHELKQHVAAQRLQTQQLHFQLTSHPHLVLSATGSSCP